jgi:hypothetical protein
MPTNLPVDLFNPLTTEECSLIDDEQVHALKQMIKSTDITKWSEMERTCIQLLQTRTKSYQIFAILAHILARDSFAGLCTALEIYDRALETFGISDELTLAIPYLDDLLSKQCVQYALTDTISVARFLAADARGVSTPIPRIANLDLALEWCTKINARLTTNYNLPCISKLLSMLRSMQRAQVTPITTSTITTIVDEHQSTSVPIARSETYRALNSIHLQLKNSEPHSPAVALLGLACKWKDYSLADIIQELNQAHSGTIDVLLAVLGRG